jgi:rare lipoprotein A
MRKLTRSKVAIFFVLVLFSVSFAQNSRQKNTEEMGVAAIYSARFQGSRTASGTIFDHAQFTASHRTHTFGTLIKITRADNGRFVVVRITDRGPFVSDRLTDLSRAAAASLGFTKENEEVRVKMEVVPSTENTGSSGVYKRYSASENESISPRFVPMPETVEIVSTKSVEQVVVPRVIPQSYSVVRSKSVSVKKERSDNAKLVKNFAPERVQSGYAVQVASVRTLNSVDRHLEALKENYFKNVLVKTAKNSGTSDYKILLGPFDSHQTAAGYAKAIRKKKMIGFVVELKKFN